MKDRELSEYAIHRLSQVVDGWYPIHVWEGASTPKRDLQHISDELMQAYRFVADLEALTKDWDESLEPGMMDAAQEVRRLLNQYRSEQEQA